MAPPDGEENLRGSKVPKQNLPENFRLNHETFQPAAGSISQWFNNISEFDVILRHNTYYNILSLSIHVLQIIMRPILKVFF